MPTQREGDDRPIGCLRPVCPTPAKCTAEFRCHMPVYDTARVVGIDPATGASAVLDARSGIIEALGGAHAKPTDRQRLESYGYRLVTWAEFEAAQDRPAGLLQRAKTLPAAFVVYDPDDGAKGFLITGGDPAALAFETVRHLELVKPG